VGSLNVHWIEFALLYWQWVPHFRWPQSATIKQGSLFVCLVLFVPMRSTQPGCFVPGLFGKLLRRRGASSWFHGVWTRGAKVLEYWMISSIKIKLNSSWKFRRNWNVPLVLLERSWWAGFNGIYLVRFGFRMWEILILKWFLPVKIQINSKNQVSEGKISWKRGNAWANSRGHTRFDEIIFTLCWTVGSQESLSRSHSNQDHASPGDVKDVLVRVMGFELQSAYLNPKGRKE
jgi:hypothetical protein